MVLSSWTLVPATADSERLLQCTPFSSSRIYTLYNPRYVSWVRFLQPMLFCVLFFLFQVQIRALIKVVSRHFVRFSFYIAGLAAKGLSHVAALIPRGVKAIRRNQPSARAASYYKRGGF